MIPYGRQEILVEDINAVIDVLNSNFLTQGPLVPQFEEAVAKHVEAEYAVAANSATSALHLACLALDLGQGDWLWTTPITFVASANCGLYCGARIDFVDIDSKTFNISVACLEEKLKLASKRGRLPKVLVAVHLCGQVCDMEAIYALCQKYGVRVIEDASHAIGAKYKSYPVGSCRYSDITIFSFHPVKIITTGEGGMAVTNDKALADRLLLLRSHGVTRDERLMLSVSDGPWYYQQIELGFNYRLTDLQAALGLSQLKRLETYVRTRNELAERYDRLLENLPLSVPWQHPDSYSARHLYVVRLKIESLNISRRDCFERLLEEGIGVNIHYIPVHLHPFYKRMGFKLGDFPEAEDYYSRAITLPLYPGLSEKDQARVVEVLGEVLGR